MAQMEVDSWGEPEFSDYCQTNIPNARGYYQDTTSRWSDLSHPTMAVHDPPAAPEASNTQTRKSKNLFLIKVSKPCPIENRTVMMVWP